MSNPSPKRLRASKDEASGEDAVQLVRDLDVHVLSQLQVLNLFGAGLTTLADNALAACEQLVQLDIGGNPLSSFPSAIASLPCLDILFAAKMGLKQIPQNLVGCPRLRILGIKDNELTSIDGARLPEGLEWLIAAGNKIHELPNIARLQKIRKLMLSHNALTCDGLAPVAGIAALEMVRVAANRLEAFPEALLRHPRLAWIAVGGNPFAEQAMERHLAGTPTNVDFNEVALGQHLGSGAGANVNQGTWREQQVAVKIWSSECFSDGTARNEWAANRVASAPGHSALVGVLGAFEEPKRGLILELLDGASAAGKPPTFSSVTRDVPGPKYTVAAMKSVALAVASACAYLHEKGLMHGDIYLHNTLVVLDGPNDAASVKDVRLSDFGAAAAVDDPMLRRTEVRSYGFLLQDLLESHVAPGSKQEAAVVSLLQQIRERCAQAAVEKLPDFVEVVGLLDGTAAKL